MLAAHLCWPIDHGSIPSGLVSVYWLTPQCYSDRQRSTQPMLLITLSRTTNSCTSMDLICADVVGVKTGGTVDMPGCSGTQVGEFEPGAV